MSDNSNQPTIPETTNLFFRLYVLNIPRNVLIYLIKVYSYSELCTMCDELEEKRKDSKLVNNTLTVYVTTEIHGSKENKIFIVSDECKDKFFDELNNLVSKYNVTERILKNG